MAKDKKVIPVVLGTVTMMVWTRLIMHAPFILNPSMAKRMTDSAVHGEVCTRDSLGADA